MKPPKHSQLLRSHILNAVAIATLIGCNPTPPTPPPPQPPTPTVHALKIYTIDDPATRTPELATLLTDIQFWRNLAQPSDTIRHFDTGNPSAANLTNALTEAGGPPALILVDAATNATLHAEKLGTDKAEISAAIETARTQPTGK